jgi:protein-tyrosine phosphatase
MVDLHQHVAFAMDDGAKTEAMAVEMLDASYADGVRALCVTPHIWPGIVPFDRQAYEEKLECLREICAERHPDLRLYPGAEMMYASAASRHLEEDRVPTLADSRFLLTEFEPGVSYPFLLDALLELSRVGYVPVLAHVERYVCLVGDINRARDLRESYAVRYQVNAASVLKPPTWRIKRFLRQMLADRWVDYVASDAHDTAGRKTCMRACNAQLTKGFGAEYALQIMGGNQMEIFGNCHG